MKKIAYTIFLILISTQCLGGETVNEINIFGKKQMLLEGCKSPDNLKKDKLEISCIPKDYSFNASINLISSSQCEEEKLNDPNSPFAKSEIVNTTINGVWYYEFYSFHAKSGFTLYQRMISNNEKCLSVIASNKEILHKLTESLWL